MTKADLLELHKSICDKARSLMERKNHDYAGQRGAAVEDPFANFRQCEHQGLCPAEVGILVRLGDKMSRLATFATAGKLLVKDEGVEDTIVDVINYAVLLAGVIKEKYLMGSIEFHVDSPLRPRPRPQYAGDALLGVTETKA